jgi:hypothetical protein
VMKIFINSSASPLKTYMYGKDMSIFTDIQVSLHNASNNDSFLGDEFSLGTNFPGTNFPRGKIFQGRSFRGRISSGTNFPGTNIPSAIT